MAGGFGSGADGPAFVGGFGHLGDGLVADEPAEVIESRGIPDAGEDDFGSVMLTTVGAEVP